MGCWVPCLAAVIALLVCTELLIVVFIYFLVTIALLRKRHFFKFGLDHQWILGVLVQDTEGHLTFLGHASIACCEVILKIGFQFVVLFAALSEEDV